MKRALLLFLLFLYSALNSQTLYWVGGSGNFNDANHWSLSSGGAVANLIPNSNTDVVFDDGSGNDYIIINIAGNSFVKSFLTDHSSRIIVFDGPGTSVLNVAGNFRINVRTNWKLSGMVKFNSLSNLTNNVTFGVYNLKCDIKFGAGNYKITDIFQLPGSKILFENGRYKFHRTFLNVDELFISGNSDFIIDTCCFNVKKSLKIKDNPIFTTSKFGIYAPFSGNGSIIPSDINLGSGTKQFDNMLAALSCSAAISVTPSCSGVCTGIFSIFIDPSCPNAPFVLNVSNGNLGNVNCQSTATNIANTFTATGTYTVGGACDCPGFTYAAVLIDNLFNFIPLTGSPFNFTPPSFFLFTLSSTPPTCAASCNGTMTLLPNGGASPYSITITPPLGPSFTIAAAGAFTMGGLCGGTYSFIITDANGCVSPVLTKVVVPPPAINPNASVTHIACAGFCTGSLSISPTGGVAGGYTVNFTPGGSFTVPAGGTASVINKCAGNIVTATVTNGPNSCTVAVGPITFTSPPALTVTPSQTNVACSGSLTGAASVSVSGGVAPYTYAWSPSVSATFSIGGLSAGTQTVTITNNGGQCTTTANFTITGPPNFTITQFVNQITCAGLTNGSASLVVTGGNGPAYGFTWSPVPLVGQFTGTISGLSPNSYTATIQMVWVASQQPWLPSPHQRHILFHP